MKTRKEHVIGYVYSHYVVAVNELTALLGRDGEWRDFNKNTRIHKSIEFLWNSFDFSRACIINDYTGFESDIESREFVYDISHSDKNLDFLMMLVSAVDRVGNVRSEENEVWLTARIDGTECVLGIDVVTDDMTRSFSVTNDESDENYYGSNNISCEYVTFLISNITLLLETERGSVGVDDCE